MLPIDSPVRLDGSEETGAEGVPPAAVAVRPPDADDDELLASEDELLSVPDGLRADDGFIGWFATWR
jgi:hypothetical protein